MKVLIENSPKYKLGNYEPLVVLMGIVKVANKSKDLKSLKENLKVIDTFGFHFGFGSSHCWVKQKENDNRILLILE